MIAPIQSLVQRAIITLVDITKRVIRLQFRTRDDITTDVPYFQHFGFRSHPPRNSDVIFVQIEASNEDPIGIATHYRFMDLEELAEGASCMYSWGDAKIVLRDNDAESRAENFSVKNIEGTENRLNITNETSELSGATAKLSSSTSQVIASNSQLDLDGELFFRKRGSSQHLIEDLTALIDAINSIVTTNGGAINPASQAALNLIKLSIQNKLRT